MDFGGWRMKGEISHDTSTVSNLVVTINLPVREEMRDDVGIEMLGNSGW